ncbi:MAG TPA: HAMP domain-containing sensor histidine kinase [Gammaproteobacteria bacterium]|nr:HAMP domain-containing sensor histidine kinase [Gammaproteobacteria bacterium]
MATSPNELWMLTDGRSMSIAEYVQANIASIAAECEARHAHRPIRATGSYKRAFRRRAEFVLRSIAADMTSRRTGGGPRTNKGTHSSAAYPLRNAARWHAEQCMEGGLTLAQMVAEYGAVRLGVTHDWLGSETEIDAERVSDLLRFNAAVDDALTEAMTWYQERIEHTRDVFGAVVAHDLRAPLGVILASADFMIVGNDPAGHVTAGQRIKCSALQMRRIVGDLLDVARIRLGSTLLIESAPMDLLETCRRVSEGLEAAHPGAVVEVECIGRPVGTWDAGRLEQMLTNLAANAVQYGRRGSPVVIRVRNAGDRVVLSVRNKGMPIPAEALRAMLDPLELRAGGRRAERRRSTSLGLGLYIARSIVLAHGGTMDIESNASGTTVIVRLPR